MERLTLNALPSIALEKDESKYGKKDVNQWEERKQ